MSIYDINIRNTFSRACSYVINTILCVMLKYLSVFVKIFDKFYLSKNLGLPPSMIVKTDINNKITAS